MTLQSSVTSVNEIPNINTKKSVTKSVKEEKISVCDVMKNHTSEVIKKIESQIPSYVQQYSDLYTQYLHMFNDVFGTCYISEKQFFDKLGIDHKTLKGFDDYLGNMTQNYTNQIDMSTEFMRDYVKMRISAIQSFDRYMHVLMDSYAKMLSQVNAVTKK